MLPPGQESLEKLSEERKQSQTSLKTVAKRFPF
jgi:hypothetical protein